MSISADVHPWGDFSLLTAPPPPSSWRPPRRLSRVLFPFSHISLYLPTHRQSKMLNFSTRGLHVQTMPVHSPCTVYRDDVTLNLGRYYIYALLTLLYIILCSILELNWISQLSCTQKMNLLYRDSLSQVAVY
jgi:hypothetical protein